jgi:ACT domain-containing protein
MLEYLEYIWLAIVIPMNNQNTQTLIVEFEGPESEIQEVLEKIEEMVEGYECEIKAVTIRND